jgi:hypothetical protein
MKISELAEALSPQNALQIHWRGTSPSFWGAFFINKKSFAIELVKENVSEIEDIFKIQLPNFLKTKSIWRVDFSQLQNNQFTYNDTGNLNTEEVLKGFSTVAFGTAKKLNNFEFNIVYFAAKSNEDNSDNPRKRIYPKIARLMAKTINGLAFTIDQKGSTISAVVQGLTMEELDELSGIN